MTNRALTFLSVPALSLGLMVLMAAPAAAQTDCQPGDLFCAELRIGPGSGSVRIGPANPPPPPPVIVEPAPQPPTVIVQPEPPPPPPQPQPPVVYVQPAPPPPPVYQPPPTVYVQPQPVVVAPRERYPSSSLGLNLHLDGIGAEDVGMGGAGASFRIRPIPHLAIDLGGSLLVGVDYNGLDRVELPLMADLLFFFNPENRLQFYALAGVGGSFAHAEGFNVHTGRLVARDYAHIGGSLGIGLEWRLSRFFALNLDVRGFIRQRVDSDPEPEFVEVRDGAWQATDTSGGFLGRLGMTFYFGH